MIRRSAFVHLVAVTPASTLAIHAMSQSRVPLAPDMVRLVRAFEAPAEPNALLPRLARTLGHDEAELRAAMHALIDRGILTGLTAEQEYDAVARQLAPAHGRDPAAQLDHWRRASAEGSHPYWSVAAPQAITEAAALRTRVDVLLFGDCDVQMETDFLRRAALRWGIDLRAAATFGTDLALASEHRHDAIIIGALQARHGIIAPGGDPEAGYASAIRTMLVELRARTAAPILIDGLPEPTVQPLGLADRGAGSHRNRFRRANLALADLAEAFADVHVVDVAAALAGAGAASLLDDGLVSFTHFGSPGWMLQRPASELAAVHGVFPDRAPLARSVGGDPYRREAVIAQAHVDALVSLLALDRKKCVIVDLDGVLWPGVLAETGSPFAWAPDVSSTNSFVGLYFGIHEALLALQRRGLVLACVSKNDEATVRALWHYPAHYPHHRLLTPDDFVTWRVNWVDKAANIAAIAAELGFALDTFLFIDDSPRERARVQQALPQLAVLGDDLFALRRTLLTDPRLQSAAITAESAGRTALVKAQLERGRLRSAAMDEAAFVESLDVACTVQKLGTADAATLGRVRELFERTTQFNATGRRFTLGELERAIAAADGGVFTLHMRDRLADHGLAGAAVVAGGEIMNLVMSCRVIGLGGERALLSGILREAGTGALRGRIVPTGRNTPVRHVYADAGFTPAGEGWWTSQTVPSEATPADLQLLETSRS